MPVIIARILFIRRLLAEVICIWQSGCLAGDKQWCRSETRWLSAPSSRVVWLFQTTTLYDRTERMSRKKRQFPGKVFFGVSCVSVNPPIPSPRRGQKKCKGAMISRNPLILLSWGRGGRTPIHGVRVRCPAIERSPTGLMDKRSLRGRDSTYTNRLITKIPPISQPFSQRSENPGTPRFFDYLLTFALIPTIFVLHRRPQRRVLER